MRKNTKLGLYIALGVIIGLGVLVTILTHCSDTTDRGVNIPEAELREGELGAGDSLGKELFDGGPQPNKLQRDN